MLVDVLHGLARANAQDALTREMMNHGAKSTTASAFTLFALNGTTQQLLGTGLNRAEPHPTSHTKLTWTRTGRLGFKLTVQLPRLTQPAAPGRLRPGLGGLPG